MLIPRNSLHILPGSTGLLTGGVVTINATNSLFDITAGTVRFVDDTTDPLNPVAYLVSFGAQTAVAVTNLATAAGTYLAINTSGTLVQATTEYDYADTRTFAPIAFLFHANNTSIRSVLSTGLFAADSGNRLNDFLNSVGVINVSGNQYSANGVNLSLNKSAGTSHAPGINIYTDKKSPDTSTDAAITLCSFQLTYRNGSGGYVVSTTTTISTTFYDNGTGTLVGIPDLNWVAIPIYFVPGLGSSGVRVQYPQRFFASKQEAIDSLPDSTFEINVNLLENATIRTWCVVLKGTTDLSDTAAAEFVHNGKFTGSSSGVGGGTADKFNIISAGTQTAGSASTVVFSNSNGISFGMSNSSVITASHNAITTGALSNHSHGNPQLNLTNISGTTASNSAGFTLSLSVGAGGANDGVNIIAAGTQTANTTGSVLFQNSNNVTFGMSNNSVVTASASFAAQTNQTIGMYAVSNTTGQSSSSTFDARTMSLHGAGIVSVGYSGGSIIISASAAGAGDGVNILAAGTQTANTNGSVLFNNANGISFGMSNNSVITASHNALTTAAQSDHSHGNPTLALTNLTGTTASASNGFTLSLSAAAPGAAVEANWHHLLGANTAGNTTASASTIGLSGINMTLSGTNGSVINLSVPATSSLSAQANITIGTTGSTIGFSVAAPGGGATYSSTVFGQMNRMATSSSASMGQNSLYLFPENLQDAVAMSILKIPVYMTFSSQTVASAQRGFTAQVGFYSRNATNSTVLTLHYSTSYTFAGSFNSNVSCAISAISAVGNSTSYNSFTSSSAGIAVSSLVHGMRELIMPFNTTLPAGPWWIGYVNSTSSAGAAGSVAFQHVVAVSTAGNRLGVAINATNDGIARNLAHGTYSATTGAMPGSINFTQVNAAATNPIIFAFHGQTV